MALSSRYEKTASFKPLRSGALDRTIPSDPAHAAPRSRFKPLRSGALDRTRRPARAEPVAERGGFKPLRSGALDRTGSTEERAGGDRGGFKPLRSGALDRTRIVSRRARLRNAVSNPFVAGHWIVRATSCHRQADRGSFQTPS